MESNARNMINIFRNHPIAISTYIIYLLFWLHLYRMTYIQEYVIPLEDSSPGYGEAIVYTFFFNVLITILFNSVVFILAIINKKERSFFFKLNIAALLPAILISVSGFI